MNRGLPGFSGEELDVCFKQRFRGCPVVPFLTFEDSEQLFNSTAGSRYGYLYRSDDGGEHWERLPVSVHFPDITTAPGSNPVKRVLMLAASESNPDILYGSIISLFIFAIFKVFF